MIRVLSSTVLCSALLGGLLLMVACQKTPLPAPALETIQVPTSFNIYRSFWVNDSTGFTAGGAQRTVGELYRTGDAGNNWELVYSIENNTLFDVFFLDDSVGFACGENYLLLYTTDGGLTWKRRYLAGDLVDHQVFMNLRRVYFANADTGYLVGGQGYRSGFFARTVDGGASWRYQVIEAECRDLVVFNATDILIPVYGGVLQFDPGADSMVFTDMKGDHFVDMAFLDRDRGFMVGFNKGLYRTTDGAATWDRVFPANKVFPNKQHYHTIHFVTDQLAFLLGNDGILFRSDNGGEDWKAVDAFTENHLYGVFQSNGRVLYIASEDGTLFKLKL